MTTGLMGAALAPAEVTSLQEEEMENTLYVEGSKAASWWQRSLDVTRYELGGCGIIISRGGWFRQLCSLVWWSIEGKGCFELRVYTLSADQVAELFNDLVGDQINVVSQSLEPIETVVRWAEKGPNPLSVGGKYIIAESYNNEAVKLQILEIVDRFFADHNY
jgi:hypothetical protein